jgi:hypothetical protein
VVEIERIYNAMSLEIMIWENEPRYTEIDNIKKPENHSPD